MRPPGLREYVVVHGRATIEEGGAPELLQQLAHVHPRAGRPLPADGRSAAGRPHPDRGRARGRDRPLGRLTVARPPAGPAPGTRSGVPRLASKMSAGDEHHSAAVLLAAEHAVARVLAEADRRGVRRTRCCWRRSGSRSAGTSARCGRPTKAARCGASRPGAGRSRSQDRAATRCWHTGKGFRAGCGRAASRHGSSTWPPTRTSRAARERLLAGCAPRSASRSTARTGVLAAMEFLAAGAPRSRRSPAAHDDEPRRPHRPVHRALARRGSPARQRGAQDGDPQRGLRLHHHHGRAGLVVEVNRATERAVRLHGGARWWAASWPS